jgi:hypothetical protein
MLDGLDNNANGVPQFPGDPPSSVQLANNKGYATGYTWVMSPNLISNLHYGYTREGAQSTGIQNAPAVRLRDIDDRYALTRGLTQIIPVHTIAEDLAWTHGGHSVAFGGVVRLINNDRLKAAEAYLRISKDKDSVQDIVAMLNDPQIVFTTTPQNIMKYVDFMYKTGAIKVKPDSWKDLFFEEAHGLPGS